LRHIENCRSLLFILFLDETTIFDKNINDQRKAQLLWQQYEQLRKELSDYDPKMLEKQLIVTINKIDLYTTKQIDTFRSYFMDKNTNVIFFSTATNQGMLEVTKAIAKTL